MLETATELSALQGWLAASPVRRIFGDAAMIAALTLLATAVGLTKELLAAARFRTQDSLDAFLLALVVPSFAVMIMSRETRSSLLPVHPEIREREDYAAAGVLRRLWCRQRGRM